MNEGGALLHSAPQTGQFKERKSKKKTTSKTLSVGRGCFEILNLKYKAFNFFAACNNLKISIKISSYLKRKLPGTIKTT